RWLDLRAFFIAARPCTAPAFRYFPAPQLGLTQCFPALELSGSFPAMDGLKRAGPKRLGHVVLQSRSPAAETVRGPDRIHLHEHPGCRRPPLGGLSIHPFVPFRPPRRRFPAKEC